MILHFAPRQFIWIVTFLFEADGTGNFIRGKPMKPFHSDSVIFIEPFFIWNINNVSHYV